MLCLQSYPTLTTDSQVVINWNGLVSKTSATGPDTAVANQLIIT